MPRSTLEVEGWHGQVDPEAVLEPELPLVDAHHHLFGEKGDRHHYRLEDLTSDLRGGHRVIGTVYVEAYGARWRPDGPLQLRAVGETETIVPICAQPLALPHGPCAIAAAIVAFADMTLGEAVEEVLDAHEIAGQGRLRGIRHRTATDPGTVGRFIAEAPPAHLLRSPEVIRACRLLGRRGLSFDVWAYHHQLGEVAELADACPDTCIVLDHVGGPIGVAEYANRREQVHAEWLHGIREVARRPNVVVKVGGMGMLVFGFGFEHGDLPADSASLADAWQPLVEECVQSFGARRCMFESNFPVDKQSAGYNAVWNAFKRVTRALSSQERCDLFGRTACRVYRLPALARQMEALWPGPGPD
jgi:predicted TIM-barrel fold metal-dependent hydrolase